MKGVLHDVANVFDTPKPTTLLKRILQIAAPKNALVLDFFAGSGTTLHAVMQLNAEDGGNRRCILVTNNENNIAEQVCYERNRRVIEGYVNSKGVAVPGLPGNALRYYRTALVGRERTLANKRALMRQATDLLCLKEGCFEELKAENGALRVFAGADGRRLLVVYDAGAIEEAVAWLLRLAESPARPASVSIYVFANGAYPYTDEFEAVLLPDFPIRVSLCALPDAIYRAYQAILPTPGY